MIHTIHIIIMCNNITVFTKSAQKLTVLQCRPISFSLNKLCRHLCHSSLLKVGDADFTNLKDHDACIFLLMEESHLAVGCWVYIETPAKNGIKSHLLL